MKPFLGLSLVLILFAGCASLPVLEIGKEQSDVNRHYYYDIDSKLAYSIDRDDDNIYLSLKTDNEATIRSIFRQGLYVYLDPSGRKGKDIFFNYPISGGGGRGMGPMMPGQRQTNQGQSFEKPSLNVNDLIDNAEVEAIFSYHKIAEKMPVYSQRTDIAVTVSSPKKGNFLYELRIPLDRLEKEAIDELSLGIMTGEMPSMAGGPGGGPGGGGSGMGGMPQGGGNMPSGGPGMGGPSQKKMEGVDINIWFKVELNGNNLPN